MSEKYTEQATETSKHFDRRAAIKVTGLAMGGAILGISSNASLAATDTERKEMTGPPDHKPSSEYAFSITATISAPMTVGQTDIGQVRAIPITGGLVEGDNITGIVVPGGADWQLTRSDGVTEIEATYAIKLDDEIFIKVVNKGIIVPPENAGDAAYFKTRIVFEAPIGKYDWLNKSIFLSRASLHPSLQNAVLIEVFRLA